MAQVCGQTPDYFDNDYFDDHYLKNGKFEKYDGYCTDIWFDEAIKFIHRQNNKPFFYLYFNKCTTWAFIR